VGVGRAAALLLEPFVAAPQWTWIHATGRVQELGIGRQGWARGGAGGALAMQQQQSATWPWATAASGLFTCSGFPLSFLLVCKPVGRSRACGERDEARVMRAEIPTSLRLQVQHHA
jgi:hypothetical protein